MAVRAFTSTALIGSLLQAGCGVAAHRDPSRPRPRQFSYADYPALLQPGPSGIGLVTPAQARAAAASRSGPLWVAAPRGRASASVEQDSTTPATGSAPDIASAREVARAGRARLWISRSSDGGVCVLSFRPELASDPGSYHAVSASCGSAGGLARGAAQVERAAGRNGPWLVSGVAPREVSAVTLRLRGGAERTVPVTHNSYSASVGRPVEGLALVAGGMRP
ncbi:MAG TPA: hypothetical protein VGO14_00485 [Solirubrobacteraceae bacterium]|jgi:hypothetical protein|nr:hypothetical protein [Solirubrobacteraceae bacterium]